MLSRRLVGGFEFSLGKNYEKRLRIAYHGIGVLV